MGISSSCLRPAAGGRQEEEEERASSSKQASPAAAGAPRTPVPPQVPVEEALPVAQEKQQQQLEVQKKLADGADVSAGDVRVEEAGDVPIATGGGGSGPPQPEADGDESRLPKWGALPDLTDPDLPYAEPSSISNAPWDLACRGVPNAPNDTERHRVGVALQLWRAPKCQDLDVVLQTLCRIFDAPYASIALYYNRCCWLSNVVALSEGLMCWEVAACPWNLLVKQPQTIACGELMEDARFHHQPWVKTSLRCYCSAPLLASNGHRLGTICFMDSVPRKVDAGMCRVLNNFGELAVRVLERHLRLAERLRRVHQPLPGSLQHLVHAAATGTPIPTLKDHPHQSQAFAGAATTGLPSAESNLQPPPLHAGHTSAPEPVTGARGRAAAAGASADVAAALAAAAAGSLSSVGGGGGGGGQQQAASAECNATVVSRAALQEGGGAPMLSSPDQGYWDRRNSTVSDANGEQDEGEQDAARVEAEGAAPPAHASSSKAAAPGPAPGAAAAAAEALPADALLASVFHKQLRNVGALEEACCLVVDTGAPGWPVMYADETWKLWAGFPRSALMGHRLQDVLAPASAGVAPLNWQALQRDADAHERFLLAGLVAVPPAATQATDPTLWHTLPASERATPHHSTGALAQQPQLQQLPPQPQQPRSEYGPQDLEQGPFTAAAPPHAATAAAAAMFATLGRGSLSPEPQTPPQNTSQALGDAPPPPPHPASQPLPTHLQGAPSDPTAGAGIAPPSSSSSSAAPKVPAAPLTGSFTTHAAAAAAPNPPQALAALRAALASTTSSTRPTPSAAPLLVAPSETEALLDLVAVHELAGPTAAAAATSAQQPASATAVGKDAQLPSAAGLDAASAAKPGTAPGSATHSAAGPPSLPSALNAAAPGRGAGAGAALPHGIELWQEAAAAAQQPGGAAQLQPRLSGATAARNRQGSTPGAGSSAANSAAQLLPPAPSSSAPRGAPTSASQAAAQVPPGSGLSNANAGANSATLPPASQQQQHSGVLPASGSLASAAGGVAAAAAAAGAGSWGGRPFSLSFRPMALDVLDGEALPLGIPSWVPLETCPPMLRLYAVRLHPGTLAPPPTQPLAPGLRVTKKAKSTLDELAGHLFPGLSMGQILGRGGYGTAYVGRWHEVAVVVKVQDHDLQDLAAMRAAQLEVSLGQMLRHPHLVCTMANAAAELPRPPDAAAPKDATKAKRKKAKQTAVVVDGQAATQQTATATQQTTGAAGGSGGSGAGGGSSGASAPSQSGQQQQASAASAAVGPESAQRVQPEGASAAAAASAAAPGAVAPAPAAAVEEGTTEEGTTEESEESGPDAPEEAGGGAGRRRGGGGGLTSDALYKRMSTWLHKAERLWDDLGPDEGWFSHCDPEDMVQCSVGPGAAAQGSQSLLGALAAALPAPADFLHTTTLAAPSLLPPAIAAAVLQEQQQQEQQQGAAHGSSTSRALLGPAAAARRKGVSRTTTFLLQALDAASTALYHGDRSSSLFALPGAHPTSAAPPNANVARNSAHHHPLLAKQQRSAAAHTGASGAFSTSPLAQAGDDSPPPLQPPRREGGRDSDGAGSGSQPDPPATATPSPDTSCTLLLRTHGAAPAAGEATLAPLPEAALEGESSSCNVSAAAHALPSHPSLSGPPSATAAAAAPRSATSAAPASRLDGATATSTDADEVTFAPPGGGSTATGGSGAGVHALDDTPPVFPGLAARAAPAPAADPSPGPLPMQRYLHAEAASHQALMATGRPAAAGAAAPPSPPRPQQQLEQQQQQQQGRQQMNLAQTAAAEAAAAAAAPTPRAPVVPAGGVSATFPLPAPSGGGGGPGSTLLAGARASQSTAALAGGLASVGTVATTHWSSDRDTGRSMSKDLAAMMQQAAEEEQRAQHKPLSFPLRLRTMTVLEFCDGGTLQDAIDRGWVRLGSCHKDAPPNLTKVLTLAQHIASACAYLHARGVVHADLSAANVLLCKAKHGGSGGSLGPTAAATLTSAGLSGNAHDSAGGAGSAATSRQALAAQPPASPPPPARASGGGGKGEVEAAAGAAGAARSAAASAEHVAVGGSAHSSRAEGGPGVPPVKLYTLPTKQYTLAPPDPRPADAMDFIAKVADFGKACLMGPEGVIKAGGYATVTHMAPEVLMDHLISPAADVYALGVLLWQMYTGSRPWAGLSHRQILVAVVNGEAQLEWPATLHLHPQLPDAHRAAAQALVALGRACMARDAARRPAMAEVEARVRQLLAELPPAPASSAALPIGAAAEAAAA